MAGFLVLLRDHFEVVRASTSSLISRVYIRSTVSRTRTKIRSNSWTRERDIYDHRSVHALLVHRRSEAVAGTVRVILPGTDREPPLPIDLGADSD